MVFPGYNFLKASRVFLCLALPLSLNAAVYDMEEILQKRVGAEGLGKMTAASRAAAVEEVAGQLKEGDALHLYRHYSVGDVDLTDIPDNVTILYGSEGRLFLGGDYDGLFIANTDCELIGMSKNAYLSKSKGAKATFRNSVFFCTQAISDVNMINSSAVEHWIGTGGKYTMNGTSFENSRILYLWYHNVPSRNAGPYVEWTDVDATNGRIYGTVEVNYCEQKSSVKFTNVKGLFYGNGDTERSNAPSGVYSFNQCENFTMVCHRNFHSHGNACSSTEGQGYVINGGNYMRMFGMVDIGDNNFFSLLATNTTNLQVFGMFCEDDAKFVNSTDPFLMFFTPKGFGDAEHTKWAAPAVTDQEVIISYKEKVIDPTTAIGEKPDFSDIEIPRQPRIPSLDMGFSSAGLGKKSASWGQKAIALGADPTGRRSSSAALQHLANEQDFVEAPAGTILLDKTVIIPFRPGQKFTIAGAGKEKTVYRTTGNFPAFDIAPAPAVLSKSIAAQTEFRFMDQTFDGGGTKDFEVVKTSPYASQRHANESYRNYLKAAVVIGTGDIDDLTAIGGYDGYDQVRWHFCDFVNTGDYGIFINNNQTDKGLYFKCNFVGQKKAGFANLRSHMFEASSIVSCVFKNIDGPGVVLGFNDRPSVGTPPGPTMLMDNQFIECGNAQKPAVDWSFTRQGLVVNNKITIMDKEWSTGFVGTGQVMQRCTVEVDFSKKASEDAVGFAFRHPRRAHNNRLTGNFFYGLSSNAGMKFVDDVKQLEATYGDNLEMPAGQCDYPWAFTHIFDSCNFAGTSFDYTLYATSKSGAFQDTINFQGAAIIDPNVLRSNKPVALQKSGVSSWIVYDLLGKKVAVFEGVSIAQARALCRKNMMASGAYVLANVAKGNIRRMQLLEK